MLLILSLILSGFLPGIGIAQANEKKTTPAIQLEGLPEGYSVEYLEQAIFVETVNGQVRSVYHSKDDMKGQSDPLSSYDVHLMFVLQNNEGKLVHYYHLEPNLTYEQVQSLQSVKADWSKVAKLTVENSVQDKDQIFIVNLYPYRALNEWRFSISIYLHMDALSTTTPESKSTLYLSKEIQASVKYEGNDGTGNFYSIVKPAEFANAEANVTFTDEDKQHTHRIAINGLNGVELESLFVIDEGRFFSSLTTNETNELKNLYVSPREMRIRMAVAQGDTVFEWETDPLMVTEPKTLKFNGTIDQAAFDMINPGYGYLYAESTIKSGDFNLLFVRSKNDHTQKASIVTVKNTETNEIVFTGDNTDYKYFSSQMKLYPGEYVIEQSLSIGDKVIFNYSKTFSVAIPEYPYIISPFYNSILTTKTVTVEGVAPLNLGNLTVELKHLNGQLIEEKAATVNTKGVFTVSFNVPQDGDYQLSVKAGDKDYLSDYRFTVNTTDTGLALSIDRYWEQNKLLGHGETLPLKVHPIDWKENILNSNFKVTGQVHYVTTEGNSKTEDISFTYNSSERTFKSNWTVSDDVAKLVSVTAVITNPDGTKLATLTKTFDLAVGATVSGSLTGINEEELKNAWMWFKNIENHSYFLASLNGSSYKVSGLPSGTYEVELNLANEWLPSIKTITVKEGEKQTVDIELPARKDVDITFVYGENKKAVSQDLYVSISNGTNFYSGRIDPKTGKFTTWNGTTGIKGMRTGTYTVYVEGRGIFKEYKGEITIKQDTDPNVTITLPTLSQSTADVILQVTNDELESLDYISLYSPSVSNAFGYESGNLYINNPDIDNDGNIVLHDVILSDDYTLYAYKKGYRYVYKDNIHVTENMSPIELTFEQGKTITVRVKADDNQPLTNVNVYAYTDTSYGETIKNADGSYTIQGLADNEPITVHASAAGRLTKEQVISADSTDPVEITLPKATFLDGVVTDAAGKPLQYVYINVFKDGMYKGWARTGKDGYFKVDGLEEGEYTIEAQHPNYPLLMVKKKTGEGRVDLILQQKGESSFVGEGNSLKASQAIVTPGKTIQYALSYKNNGNADATNVPVKITLPSSVTFEGDVKVNGTTVEHDNGAFTLPIVKAGESGTITFAAKVKTDASDPSIRVQASVGEGSEQMLASTTLLAVTLTAPEQTATDTIKVYGNAQDGATVEVFVDGKPITKVTASGRWWFAEVKLPLNGTDKQEFKISAKVTKDGLTSTSETKTVTYDPEIPSIKDVSVYAGWNGTVKLNPYTGLATFAVVEKTPLDTTVTFDDTVDSASILFLGEEYPMTKGTGNTYTFDGKKLGDWSSYGEQLLQISFTKNGVKTILPLMQIIVLIDPSGYVFEGSMENRLEGVTAVVYEQKDGSWVPWNAALYGQVNPQVTDEEGRYGWDVIQGKWRVEFTKEGYEPYTSRIVVVPPAETQLNVPLVRTTAPEVKSITPANGATNVDAKEITIEFDRLMDKQSIEQYVKVYKVGKNGQETLVEGTFSYDKVFNGYKEDVSKRNDSLLDGNGQSGWFIEDPNKKLVKKVVFKPEQAFAEGTTYKVVVPTNVVDYVGKQLVADTVYTFTTKEASNSNPGNDGNPSTPPSSIGGGSTPTSPGGGYVPTTPADQSLGKEVIDEKVGEKTLVVSEEKLLEQVKNQQEAVISLTTKDNEKNVQTLSAQLTAQTVKKLIGGKKSLVITANGSMLTFTTDTLKGFVTGNAESVKVSVNAKDAANKQLPVVLKGQNIVSKLYDFTVAVQASGKTLKVESFNAPVQVAVEIGKVTDTRKTAAYYLNEKANAWEYAGGKVKDGKFVFNAYHFSTYAVIENAKQFKDVTADMAWAKNEIEILAARTIIKGRTGDIFAPNANITRAQFAVLLARALQLPKQEYQGIFDDVPKNLDWAALEIEAASRAGIVKGSNGKFRPYENITRQQMAAMIARAIEYKNAQLLDGLKKELPFADAQAIDAYAKDSVAYATALGIIKGRTINGKVFFAPKENATRAQAAVMLYRLLETLDEF
jgi:uncharacterized repeat protein (TIGR01451 family)